jgi:hypothetical protein
MVMAAISRDFDLKFAPGYLENVEMVQLSTGEQTPRYKNSITLPMVLLLTYHGFLVLLTLNSYLNSWNH